MCGRYTLSTPAGRLAEEFQLDEGSVGPYAELQRRPYAGGSRGSGGRRGAASGDAQVGARPFVG